MLAQNQILNQGRYRIIHPYGTSESGGLYEAYDTVSNTKVVLRESSGGLGGDATPAQMETLKITFADQAKVLADIRHETLLGIRDYFSETGRKYLVMESFEGSGLSDFVEAGKTPTVVDVAQWTDQLLDALEYLHSRTPCVIHQDINPQNIRLSSDNKVKLLVTGSEAIDSRPIDTSVPAEGALNYKALEQLWTNLDYASQKVIANSFDEQSQEILGQPIDARCDLYALAATVYHVLTGVAPADPLARTIEMLEGNEDPLLPPHDVYPAIPVSMSDFLMKALEIKRERRYSTAAAMRAALNGILMSLQSSKPAAAVVPDTPEPAVSNAKHEVTVHTSPKADMTVMNRATPAWPVAPSKSPAAKAPSGVTPLDELKLELASDDLLDLPEPTPESIHTTSAGDVLSLDVPVQKEVALGSMFEAEEPKAGLFRSPIIMLAGAALVVVLAVGGWLVFGPNPKSASPAPAPAAPLTESPIVPSEPAVSQPAAQNEAPPAAAPEAAIVESQPTAPEADRRAAIDGPKPKKQQPAAAKPTPEKKKVTVDDLINDN